MRADKEALAEWTILMNTMKQTVLNVGGMTCSSCVRHVEGALRELDGIRDVEVRLREGKVVVAHEAQQPSVPAMIEALREAGYESTPDVQQQASA